MTRLRIKVAFMAVTFCSIALSRQLTQDAGKNPQAASQVHEIQVTVKKYSFDPSPIRVKKGEPVKLIVTATDRDHGIKIDAFHVSQKLKKGEPAVIEFTPDQEGTFPFKCSVFCGMGHGGMKGTLVVEE